MARCGNEFESCCGARNAAALQICSICSCAWPWHVCIKNYPSLWMAVCSPCHQEISRTDWTFWEPNAHVAIEVPQTCGARHVRQDMATSGAIHPPCGPASVQVGLQLYPIMPNWQDFGRFPRFWQRLGGAKHQHFFPCFNFLKMVLMFEFGHYFFLPAFSGLLFFLLILSAND